MKTQEIELALEEVEKAGEEQAKCGKQAFFCCSYMMFLFYAVPNKLTFVKCGF